MIGAHLVLGCQRSGCEATEEIDMGVLGPGLPMATAHSVAEILEDDWPEGWGWDQIGVDRVLHCPEHRGS